MCLPILDFARLDGSRRRGVEQISAQKKLLGSVAVAEKAVVPEPHKSRWQDVNQKATNELVRR